MAKKRHHLTTTLMVSASSYQTAPMVATWAFYRTFGDAKYGAQETLQAWECFILGWREAMREVRKHAK